MLWVGNTVNNFLDAKEDTKNGWLAQRRGKQKDVKWYNDTLNQGTSFDTIWIGVSFSPMVSETQRDSSLEFSLYPHFWGSLLLVIWALDLGNSHNNLMKGKVITRAGSWEGERKFACSGILKGVVQKLGSRLGGSVVWVGVRVRCLDGTHTTKQQFWVGRWSGFRRVAKNYDVHKINTGHSSVQSRNIEGYKHLTSREIWATFKGNGNEAMVYE